MAKTLTKTTPPRKPATRRKRSADKGQFERFVEAAKAIGVDESRGALDRAFDKVATKKPSSDHPITKVKPA